MQHYLHRLGKTKRFGEVSHNDAELQLEALNGCNASGTTPMAEFYEFSSGTTDLPEGIIHIFREAPKARVDEVDGNSPSTSKVVSSARDIMTLEDQTIVAVLAVPSWMSSSDFLAFVAPAAEGMAHLRLIRDSSPNRTMAVIQFRDSSSATEFIEEFNGQQFNTIEVSSNID